MTELQRKLLEQVEADAMAGASSLEAGRLAVKAARARFIRDLNQIQGDVIGLQRRLAMKGTPSQS